MTAASYADASDMLHSRTRNRVDSSAGALEASCSATTAKPLVHGKDASHTRSGTRYLADVTNQFRGSVSIETDNPARKGSRQACQSSTTSAESRLVNKRLEAASAAALVEQPAAGVPSSHSHTPEWRARIERIEDIDTSFQGNRAAVQLLPQLAQTNVEFMREQELRLRASAYYINDVQPSLNVNMRAVLVDWLIEVADDFRLVTETLYLAISYMDRFLSVRTIDREELQLLGITCLYIAAKYEEIQPPSVERFAYVTDRACSVDDIVDVEAEVLQQLGFQLSTPTSKAFLQRFLRTTHVATQVEYKCLEPLCRYILELSLLDFHVLQYRGSTLAAATVFLARLLLAHMHKQGGDTLPHTLWTRTMEHYTFHSAEELAPCVQKLHKTLLHAAAKKVPLCVTKKYKSSRRGSVSQLRFLSELPSNAFEQYAAFPVPVDYFAHLL